MSLDLPLLPEVSETDLPRWFQLSFRRPKKGCYPALIFEIGKESAPHIQPLLKTNRMVGRYEEDFGRLLYESDLSYGFGFDSIMRNEGTEGPFLRLVMPINPRLPPPMLAASCSILFMILGFNNDKVRIGSDASRLQLIDLECYWLKEKDSFHGAPIGGRTSPALTAWVAAHYLDERIKNSIKGAMLSISKTYFPSRKRDDVIDRLSFGVSFGKNGHFELQCPGNACTVSTDVDFHQGNGLSLICHNLDTCIQQLMLLAGLAELCGLAAKDLDKK
jgi:hypothetical protein